MRAESRHAGRGRAGPAQTGRCKVEVTDTMPSPWAAIDGLMRELRTLRDDARALDAALSSAVVAEVERLNELAAQAVDETVREPESEFLLTGAARAIAEAHERIEALKVIPTRSAEVVGIDLRRGPSRRPYKQIATTRKHA